jgi:methylmalonyl-CoA mutase N-terminal domain/subunit
VTSGILRGIEDGWFTGEIAESAFRYQQALEKGDKKQVGVNVYAAPNDDQLEILRISHQVEVDQRELLRRRRAERDEAEVGRRLKAMVDVARGSGNLVEPMLDAVRAEATLGEVCNALKAEWGEYREPARF